jgi:hypothetical protein
LSDVGSGAGETRRLRGHPSTRKDERQMTSDIFVERTPSAV